MSRLPSHLVAVLCAIALTAAACADGSDEATDAPADDAAASSTDGDGDVAADQGDQANSDDASSETVELVAAGEQFAPVQVIGEALESMPPQIPVTESDNDPAIGQVAPDVTGTSFDGSPVTITADGTPRAIMFVAHWCPHCRREIPAVKALIDDGAVPEGLEIVVVSTAVREGDPNFPPQQWLEDEEWPGLMKIGRTC